MITTEAALAPEAVEDRYLTRQATMITVRMTAGLKERLDQRIKSERRARRRVSLNTLCVQALISVLDQLDAAEESVMTG